MPISNMNPTYQVLVIDAHPDVNSLSAALAHSHAQGLRQAHAQVHVLSLRELNFDPIRHANYHQKQALEPDLHEAQRLMTKAQRIVIVTPVWWGAVPALLKGFFDRVLEPHWAFRIAPNGHPEGLLAGRSARIILTSDSPGFYLRFVQGDSVVKSLVRSTLNYCGIKPVDVTRIGPVYKATPSQKESWLRNIQSLGVKDAQHHSP